MSRPHILGKASPASDPAHERWLDEVLTLAEAAALRRVSVDTLRREGKLGKIKIRELSAKRRGVTRREALRSRDGDEAA